MAAPLPRRTVHAAAAPPVEPPVEPSTPPVEPPQASLATLAIDRAHELVRDATAARARLAATWDEYVTAYTLASEAERAIRPHRIVDRSGTPFHDEMMARIMVQAKGLSRQR